MSRPTEPGVRRVRPVQRWVALLAVALLALVGALAAAPTAAGATGCRIYVASGDDVPAGNKLDDNTKRFPERLLADHLVAPGWCLYNQSKNGTTSATYLSGGGMASAYNSRPDLHTLTLGEQNSTVVDLVSSCFDKVKDHDFAGGAACASAVLANSSVWSGMTSNYTSLLQTERIMASQRPGLVVAVTGYANPYPRAVDIVDEVTELCVSLIDTIPTCAARWAQLAAALLAIDQAFQKLNTTVKNALAPFQQGPNGSRYVFVDVYPKFASHCMTMKVTIKTRVEHPEESGAVHQHDSPEVNFGCSTTWFVEGSDGTAKPNYLLPASLGVLVDWSQTTSGMGVYPNAAGQQCIADAIWDADTIDPGTTPLKWKLGYAEAAKTDVCSG
ncbi:MAG: hypothetical protein ABJA89_09645 [Lapillicoccus sp.]